MPIAPAALALAAVLAADVPAPRPAPRRPIIDVHLHAYPAAHDLSATMPNPISGVRPTARNGAEHMRQSLDEMAAHGIVLGVVSPSEGSALETTLAWRRAAPARIVAAFACDGSPESPFPDIAELRVAVENGSIQAFGELGPQYAGLTLEDPRFEPILALAEAKGLPIGVHTGISFPGISYDPCCPAFRAHLGNPLTLEEVLNRHPKLRLYLMHAGWPWTQETVAVMSLYPQVYADLAVVNWIIPREAFRTHLRALLDAGMASRLMFGSDQMSWPDAIGMAIDGIESVPFLTAAQKDDIFCGNAARFFRLEGEKNPCRPTPPPAK